MHAFYAIQIMSTLFNFLAGNQFSLFYFKHSKLSKLHACVLCVCVVNKQPSKYGPRAHSFSSVGSVFIKILMDEGNQKEVSQVIPSRNGRKKYFLCVFA